MKILIVDDDPSILRALSLSLETLGHTPYKSINTRDADLVLKSERINLILLDMAIGSESGIDYIEKLRTRSVDIPIVVLTGNASIHSAVESIRKGAFDYLPKPIVPEQIQQLVSKFEHELSLQQEIDRLATQIANDSPKLINYSKDPAMNQVFQLAFRAAESEASILILGPSGTGKTVLARSIHQQSLRKAKAFITVNCPSLSSELFESNLFGHVRGAFTGAVQETWGKVSAADGGTLFLDEIGELPDRIQSKLLRLLQDKEYERIGETKTRNADVRIVAATNRDLKKAVERGTFREDLFYRLNVISLQMPPLSKRPTDIMALAENYLNFFTQQQGKTNYRFSECAIQAMTEYCWPGNLRELRNSIERAVILSLNNTISLEDLPDDICNRSESLPTIGQSIPLSKIEEAHIRQILNGAKNVEQAAKTLGIDTATLYRKRKKYGMT